jgi:hypothetical protein
MSPRPAAWSTSTLPDASDDLPGPHPAVDADLSMTSTRFDVVFQKLAEAGQDAPHAAIESVQILQSEYDEIDVHHHIARPSRGARVRPASTWSAARRLRDSRRGLPRVRDLD